MRRAAFMMMTAMCSAAALGQGLLDCVEPDVLRTLLDRDPVEHVRAFSAGVPAEVAALEMPRGFSWIGSAEREVQMTAAVPYATRVTAAWRTSLEPDAARAATTAALEASGWAVRESPIAPVRVFIGAVQQDWQTACRNGQPVTFTVSSLDRVSYVLFNIQRGMGNASANCNLPWFMGMPSSFAMQEFLPTLHLPVDPGTGALPDLYNWGSSSNRSKVIAEAQFAFAGPAADVAQHLASQMSGQGWIADADWSGKSATGSSWSKQDGEAIVHAMLTVTASGDGQVRAALHLRSLP